MAERLNVQLFLDDNSPESLTASLGIAVKQHPAYPELFQFSYDQIESPKAHPIVRECRGVILNSKNNWTVEAYPFRRFANYGETWADAINWNSTRVQEKVDGSLMILWWYGGRWNVSTKGSPDAGGNVGDFTFTFSDLFWGTFTTQYPKSYAELQSCTTFRPQHTYMVEMTSIYNRVVCRYGENPALTLLGVRDIIADGHPEIPISTFAHCGLPLVKEYPLRTVDEVEKAALVLDPMHNEGFVVVDADFNRVKLKSPSYVMIHHLKDGFGQRRIIRLIQLGETAEVLSYFPEYQQLFDDIKAKIDAKIADIEADWNRLKHITDRKAFALEAQQCKESGVLFALFLGKATTVRDYVLYSKKVIRKATATEAAIEDFQMSEEKIERMIGLKVRTVPALEE